MNNLKGGNKVGNVSKRVLSLLMAASMIGSFCTACTSEKTKTQDETTIETTMPNEETGLPFKRDDGAYLQLLCSYNPVIEEKCYDAGYITFDENGVYFDNAVTGAQVILSDKSLFEDTTFEYMNFSSLCVQEQLLDGKIKKEEIKKILDDLKNDVTKFSTYWKGLWIEDMMEIAFNNDKSYALTTSVIDSKPINNKSYKDDYSAWRKYIKR